MPLDAREIASRPPEDKNTSAATSDSSNHIGRRSTPQSSGTGPKLLKNAGERSSTQKRSTTQDGGPETLAEVSSVPQSNLTRVKLNAPKKSGSKSESSSSDMQDDYVHVKKFDDDIGASDAPKQSLPHNPRDIGSNSGPGEGDHMGSASYASSGTGRDRDPKRSCRAEERTNVQVSESVEGSSGRSLPRVNRNQDSETQGSGGYNILGNITTTIQAAVMPTPQQKNQQLKEELYNVQGQLADTKEHLKMYSREFERAQAEMRQMVHHINSVEHERQRLTEANQSYENELSIIRRELQDAKNLASIRGKELLGAQVFLTKADGLSISEVIDKVNNLNEEIFQAAALLGEVLIHKPHNVSQEEMHYAIGIVQGMIGRKITNILREQYRKEVPGVNPLIVQVVLQVFLVTHCNHLVQSWSNDPACASYLAAIYNRIRGQEEQAVSGRWRSLTRSHTPSTSDGLKDDLLVKLGSLLRVAEWMTPGIEQRRAFEQKLEPIFRAVGDLRNALGEKFTSADLEASVMESDQVFQPAYMEDAYGDPRKYAPQEVVVGTTGIGLKKALLQRSEKGDVMFANVLSAKVVLESTLLEALQPPPPAKSGRRNLTKSNEEVLSQPPKKDSGSGTPKPSSYTSKAATAHASQVRAASPHPPAPPKKGPTSVKLVEQQQQRGTPESPKNSGGAGSAPQQRKLNRPPNRGASLDSAGGGSRPQRAGQQRELSIPERGAGDNVQDDGGILGALQHMEY